MQYHTVKTAKSLSRLIGVRADIVHQRVFDIELHLIVIVPINREKLR